MESERSQEGSHKPHLHPQCGQIYPLLDVAEHREAGTYYSIIHEYPMTLIAAHSILADKTHHVQPATHSNRDWNRLLPTSTGCRQQKVGKCDRSRTEMRDRIQHNDVP
jgi:hypothetical protein